MKIKILLAVIMFGIVFGFYGNTVSAGTVGGDVCIWLTGLNGNTYKAQTVGNLNQKECYAEVYANGEYKETISLQPWKENEAFDKKITVQLGGSETPKYGPSTKFTLKLHNFIPAEYIADGFSRWNQSYESMKVEGDALVLQFTSSSTSGSFCDFYFYYYLLPKGEKKIITEDNFNYGWTEAKEPTYTGAPIKMVQKVYTRNSVELTEGKDYTIEYVDNINAGLVQIKKLTGIGDYSGNLTFDGLSAGVIKPKSIENLKISLSKTSYYYTGKAINPVVNTITYNGMTLVKGKDYKVTYSDNVKAGVGKVTITGLRNYDGSVEKTFTIKKYNQKISVAKLKTYKAKELKKKAIKIKLKAKTTGNGKLSYTIVKGNKNYISVSKTGLVTLKKNAKKGTYKVNIKASSTAKYKKATKLISITVK